MTVQGLSLEHIARQNAELKAILSTIDLKMQEGSKARQAADNAAASVRILEKKNLVLNNENRRLFRKIDDLGNLIEEQTARIEELEEQAGRPKQPEAYQALINEKNKYKNRCADYERKINQQEEIIRGKAPQPAEDIIGEINIVRKLEAERDALKEKVEHERSINADLKEAQQATAKKVLHLEQERARMIEEYRILKLEKDNFERNFGLIKQDYKDLVKRSADLKTENERIITLLKKLGFNYISVFPVPSE